MDTIPVTPKKQTEDKDRQKAQTTQDRYPQTDEEQENDEMSFSAIQQHTHTSRRVMNYGFLLRFVYF